MILWHVCRYPTVGVLLNGLCPQQTYREEGSVLPLSPVTCEVFIKALVRAAADGKAAGWATVTLLPRRAELDRDEGMKRP